MSGIKGSLEHFGGRHPWAISFVKRQYFSLEGSLRHQTFRNVTSGFSRAAETTLAWESGSPGFSPDMAIVP